MSALSIYLSFFVVVVGEVGSEWEWMVVIENHLDQTLSWGRLLRRARGHCTWVCANE